MQGRGETFNSVLNFEVFYLGIEFSVAPIKNSLWPPNFSSFSCGLLKKLVLSLGAGAYGPFGESLF